MLLFFLLLFLQLVEVFILFVQVKFVVLQLLLEFFYFFLVVSLFDFFRNGWRLILRLDHFHQTCIFFPQLSNKLIGLAFVNHGFVLDLLGLIRIALITTFTKVERFSS